MPKSPFSEDRNRSDQGVQDISQSTNINSPIHQKYASINDYIHQIDPSLLSNLNKSQIQSLQTFIRQAISHEKNQAETNTNIDRDQRIDSEYIPKKKRSKLIDIRFIVDLIFSRFYVVLLVGKDIRKGQRSYPVTGATKVGNMIAAFLLIVGLNLLISAFCLLGLYLLKSALGINLLPGHFSDQIEMLK